MQLQFQFCLTAIQDTAISTTCAGLLRNLNSATLRQFVLKTSFFQRQTLLLEVKINRWQTLMNLAERSKQPKIHRSIPTSWSLQGWRHLSPVGDSMKHYVGRMRTIVPVPM